MSLAKLRAAFTFLLSRKQVNDMTRNLGLLEIALEIASTKANGCDGGDCSCDEGDECLATGWEAFAPQPPQPEQPTQPQKPIL